MYLLEVSDSAIFAGSRSSDAKLLRKVSRPIGSYSKARIPRIVGILQDLTARSSTDPLGRTEASWGIKGCDGPAILTKSNHLGSGSFDFTGDSVKRAGGVTLAKRQNESPVLLSSDGCICISRITLNLLDLQCRLPPVAHSGTRAFQTQEHDMDHYSSERGTEYYTYSLK